MSQTRRAWQGGAAGVGMLTAVALAPAAVGAVVPHLISDLGVSKTDIGIASAALWVGVALGAALLAPRADL